MPAERRLNLSNQLSILSSDRTGTMFLVIGLDKLRLYVRWDDAQFINQSKLVTDNLTAGRIYCVCDKRSREAITALQRPRSSISLVTAAS